MLPVLVAVGAFFPLEGLRARASICHESLRTKVHTCTVAARDSSNVCIVFDFSLESPG